MSDLWFAGINPAPNPFVARGTVGTEMLFVIPSVNSAGGAGSQSDLVVVNQPHAGLADTARENYSINFFTSKSFLSRSMK